MDRWSGDDAGGYGRDPDFGASDQIDPVPGDQLLRRAQRKAQMGGWVDSINLIISWLLAYLNSPIQSLSLLCAFSTASRARRLFASTGWLFRFLRIVFKLSRTVFEALPGCLVARYRLTTSAHQSPSRLATPTNPSLALRAQPARNTPSRILPVVSS